MFSCPLWALVSLGFAVGVMAEPALRTCGVLPERAHVAAVLGQPAPPPPHADHPLPKSQD